ncbi:MAG: hypothetical protein KDD43_04265, partial [Bdellovibrionales bacterium]|nr:hypothetical protein [Bdellovibrionales bacterium]
MRSLNGQSGERMGGVDVRLYQFDWKTGHRLANSYKTDREGEVKIKGSSSHTHYVFAQKGEDLGLIHNGIYFSPEGQRAEHEAHLVYLDRSLYRPGQKIFWKSVSFHGKAEEGQLSGYANTNLEVTLKDANHKDVEKVQVRTNEFGTASGEFKVPTGRILGGWHIMVRRSSGRGGQAYFRVEEYKRPTFEVTVGDSVQPMKVNLKAQVKGEVKYYHGLPVTSGKVRWTVSRQRNFPWWWGWYYWRGGGGSAEQILTAGESSLNNNGVFTIDFIPEGDPEDEKKEVSYTYRVQVDVTDEGGETRSSERSYRVGFVAVQARVHQVNNFFDAKERVNLQVHRSSLDGKALAGKGRYRIHRIRQPKGTPMPAGIERPNPEPNAYQHPDDFKTARWESNYNWKQVLFNWKTGAMVQSGRVKHEADGLGKVSLNLLPAGPYRMEYVTRDRFGKEAKTTHDFLVVGKGFKLNLPLVVLPEKNSYRVGDQVRLLIHSGYPKQAINFFVGQNSQKSLRQIRRVGQAGLFHDFRLGPEWRGGFFVEAGFVHDFQSLSQSLSVHIPWENKQLKVEYERIRKKMEPGSKEKWIVKVQAPGKKEALEAGELLAYMYDRSLEAFAPHSPPSTLGHYPGKGYNSFPLSYHLHQAPGFSLWGNGWYYGHPVSFHGDYLKEFASYGIGGLGSGGGGYGGKGRMMYDAEESVMAVAEDRAFPASAPPAEARREKAKKESNAMEQDRADTGLGKADAKPNAEEPAQEQVRKNFSETAFWQPHLKWNKQGQVSLEFQVPDSVTSWKVWAHALTTSIQDGMAQTTVETVKDLMVRPYLPRFVREGDRASMKIVVQNASKTKQSVK